MVEFLVGFFSSDYAKVITGLVAFIAFGFSLYNFVMGILREHPNLILSISEITPPVNGVQQVFLEMTNPTSKNLVILDIIICANDRLFRVERKSKLYKRVTKRYAHNDTTTKEYFTVAVPVTVKSLDCLSGCFEFRLSDTIPIPLSKISVKMETNRGKIKKTIDLSAYSKYIT